jgi:hypothetical protein
MRHGPTSADRPNGHPFRKRMRHVRVEVRRREDDSDIKLFAVSFTAFFICFYTFLL